MDNIIEALEWWIKYCQDFDHNDSEELDGCHCCMNHPCHKVEALEEARKMKSLLEESDKRKLAIKKSLDLIIRYGGIDGSHHKQWLLDQIVRTLSSDYNEWVREFEDGSGGPNTYEWDEGIAP